MENAHQRYPREDRPSRIIQDVCNRKSPTLQHKFNARGVIILIYGKEKEKLSM